MLTRLGNIVIATILGVAIVAVIVVVVWPGGSDDERPQMDFARVVDYARFGAVTDIDANGTNLTVHFREDFDTSSLKTKSHTFRSSLEEGQDITGALQFAGIRVNGADGVRVTAR